MAIKSNAPHAKKHNSTIAIWKFLFSLLILFRHAETYNPEFANSPFNFIGGSIGIFFFFIVSGYLMTKNALGKDVQQDTSSLGKLTFNFIWKKIKVFFPFILFAFIAGLIVNIVRGEEITLQTILNSIFSLFVLPQSFIAHRKFVGVAWYISVMLAGMMILYPLIVKHKKNFILIISPLIVLLLFGFMNKMDNGSYSHSDIYYFGYLPKSLLSAIAGLSLGSLSFALTEKLNSIKFTRLAKVLLTLFYIACFTSTFFISCLPNSHQKYDSFMIVTLFLGVSIAFSDIPITRKITDNKLSFYLEKLSLPLYLNHMWIMNAMLLMSLGTSRLSSFICISTGLSIVVSIVAYNATRLYSKVLSNRRLQAMIIASR